MKKIIICEETFRIGVESKLSSKFETVDYHDATDVEKRYILRKQHELLKYYDCRDEFDLFFKKSKDDYYNELHKIFYIEKGWKNVYSCYKIIFDKEIVLEEINEQEEILEFNDIILETLNTQADANYKKKGITADNAGERYLHGNGEVFFYHEDNPNNQKILAEKLIRKRTI